jgi:hypothetical protein
MYLIFIFHYLDHPGPKAVRPLFPLSLGETPLSGSVKVLRYKLVHCPAGGRDLYVEVGMLGNVRFGVPVRVQQRHPIIESESRQALYRTLRGYPEMYTKMASLGLWSEELLERGRGDVPVSYLFYLVWEYMCM